eukprot:TRINITY_DN2719_c0_g1_i18.p1 TRINITY_DN2719_c0_g1~~TRINITY_DN2719_c0_g1_i18.p1  ORF type:complete len:113 (-),score=13.00 TRINITY_DN2719_c0_g1_i18:558-896(-)
MHEQSLSRISSNTLNTHRQTTQNQQIQDNQYLLFTQKLKFQTLFSLLLEPPKPDPSKSPSLFPSNSPLPLSSISPPPHLLVLRSSPLQPSKSSYSQYPNAETLISNTKDINL